VLLPDVNGMTGLVSQLKQQSIEAAPLPLIPVHAGAIRQTRKAVSLNVLRLYRYFRKTKPDLIHFVMSWPTRDSWCGMVAALLLGIPYVVDFQLVPPSLRCPATTRGLLKHLPTILRYVFNRADRLICVSEGNKDRLAAFFGIGKQSIDVVHNGIDCVRYQQPDSEKVCQLRKEFRLSPDKIAITTVARLNIQKGHSDLIEVAKRVTSTNPEVVFILAGDGELRRELELATSEAELAKNIIFTGYRKEIPEILAMTDIFFLPTLFEGLPHAVLEAMAAARCVVASRVDGVCEAVSDGETGILVDPGNINHLTEALTNLIRNIQFREEMGKSGRRRVQQSFGIDRMVDKLEGIYARSCVLKTQLSRPRGTNQ
jgi:glycosyltransferase involved in cell wall biosynthesis